MEQAAELVDVGRTLARWQYHWEKISIVSGALLEVASVAVTVGSPFNQVRRRI